MTFRGNHVDELISASLTGDLTDAERAELDAHLARCESCRATLAAFKAERRILSGLPLSDPPRDLSARVRSGIEAGRFPSGPWWRRRGGIVAIGASLATVAAAILAVVVLSKLQSGPVGQASGSPNATLSSAPSSSAVESAAPSVAPTRGAVFALGSGELGYLSLNGAPLEAGRLSLINDATGSSLDLGAVSGPPVAAALSPDGKWLAYITQKGETGANDAWALHLTDGTVTALGCSAAVPFTNRLAWSPDSAHVAYTLAAVDLGPDSGCPANDSPPATTDAWVFATATSERTNLTHAGNAFAASFTNFDRPQLTVSFAAQTPGTTAIDPQNGIQVDRVENVFMPLLSPDGNRAIFWSGSMASNGGQWQFSLGGMPQLSRDFRSTGPASPWVGTPLFTDLTPVGGEAFAHGDVTWGPDSDQIAFWNGFWTGAPQSADGSYPGQTDVYVGRVSTGLLSADSRLGLVRPDDTFTVTATFSPDGTMAAVTIGLPRAGIGDPPSAYLELVPLDGSTPHSVGGDVEPPPWNGPAVYGR